MGLLNTWFYQLTQPLRNLKSQLLRMTHTLLHPFVRQKNIAKGVVKDVRQLGGAAGRLAPKPKEQPKQPPPKQPPRR